MMKRFSLLAVFPVVTLIALCFACPIQADLMISFTEDGSLAEFNVNPGEQIDIPVYLRQSGDVESELGTHLTTFGVKTFGVNVMSANMVSGRITGATLADDWKNGILSKVQLNAEAGSAALFGSRPLGVNDALFPAGNSNSILLGHLVYEALSPGSNIFTAADPDGKKQIVLGDNRSYDAAVFSEVVASATINTVPEPGTLALGLMGLVSVGAITALRRRRQ